MEAEFVQSVAWLDPRLTRGGVERAAKWERRYIQGYDD